ncbi:hypothetical protein [Halocella sp. SP3-1]|uniref:hypothetical protein n=1 Tax=Halocella sp. SP3-1 TaxID=2382161 RepID=UPI000F74C07C|nr:hypothetical protein [Halocella sp. SP3-1]AZO93736.1 hypothetical protein D7D81_03530 [Halocella sp. SP3-1]
MQRKINCFILLVLVVFVLVGCGGGAEVTFCESVDDNLKPINSGSVFTTGQLAVRIESPESFGTNKLEVSLYKVNGESEQLFDRGEREVNPDWNIFALTVYFADPGEYKVVFSKPGGEKIASSSVEIQ